MDARNNAGLNAARAVVAMVLCAVLMMACGEDSTSYLLPIDPATGDSTTVVYFASDRLGHFELYALQDTLPTRLTRDNAYDSWWPRLSPTRGTLLLYRAPAKDKSNNTTEAELWAMQPDGGNLRRLIALADNGWTAQSSANWSPDGRHIVMAVKERAAGRWRLFVTDSNGKNPVAISNRGGVYLDPAYSPDGARIVCSAIPPGVAATDMSRAEITVLNTDGSGERQLTNDTLRDGHPEWSPDGTEIVFETEVDPLFKSLGKWALRAVNADGSAVRTILDDGNINAAPHWTTRSSYVYFQRYVFGGEPFRIDRVARDGSDLEKYTVGIGNYGDEDVDPEVVH